MVGVIVRLQQTLSRNRRLTGHGAQLVLGASLGFALATATIVLAFVDLPLSVRGDLVAIALALWLLGWLVAPSFTGGPELTGNYFRMHPIPRRTLTLGLFVAAWTRIPTFVVLAAFVVLVAFAVPLGLLAVLIALVAAPLSVAILILAARLTGIWFAAVSRSRLGAVISSIVTAAIIVVAQHSWILVLAVMRSFDAGLPGGAATVLGTLPTSWGLAAVRAAGGGDWTLVAALLAALLALCVLLYVVWTRVVTTPPLHKSTVRARRHRTVGGLSPLRKELLAWYRDPLRLQDVVLALAYAIGTCALPLVLNFGALLPFAGATLVLMGVATSCNLYGAAGTALWMTLAVPGSERSDVRSRQTAWTIVFGGLGLALTVIGVAFYPDPVLLPWVIGSFLAVLGAGAGLIALLSVKALVPTRDPHVAKHSPADQGDTTGPAFLAIFATMVIAAPTIALLTVGQVLDSAWPRWAGMGVGVLTAVVVPWLMGAATARELVLHGPELMHRMQSGSGTSGEPGVWEQTRAALRGESIGADKQPTDPAKISGFEAMRPVEQIVFWGMYVLAILAIIPQGLVAAAHLLADSGERSWFLALHAVSHLQWLTVAGFLVIGTCLAATATAVFVRARRRARMSQPAPV